MPLIIAPCNKEMEVRRITADDKTKRHLMEMGITEGGKITLLSSGSSGVIVVVKEGRLCLDGGLSRKILVA